MNQVRYSSRASSGTCSVKIAPLPSAAPASGLMSGLTQDVIRQPRPAPLPVSAEVLRTEALYKDAGYVLPHGAVVPNGGTSGAHQREICPEVLRTAEISAAGQALCHVHPRRSDTSTQDPAYRPTHPHHGADLRLVRASHLTIGWRGGRTIMLLAHGILAGKPGGRPGGGSAAPPAAG